MSAALPAVALALGALTVGQLLSSAARHRQRLLPQITAHTAQEMLAAKAVSLDLEALETPAFHDWLLRAQREAPFRPANMVQDLAQIALIGYLQSVLTLLDSAKETRAFGTGEYLLKEQRRLFGEELGELRQVIRQRQRRDMLATLASSIVSAAGMLLVLWLHFSGHISLAETAAAAGALLLMLPRVSGLMTSVGLLHENALFVEDFWAFLDIEPQQIRATSPEPMPSELSCISVENLTFAYPTPRCRF